MSNTHALALILKDTNTHALITKFERVTDGRTACKEMLELCELHPCELADQVHHQLTEWQVLMKMDGCAASLIGAAAIQELCERNPCTLAGEVTHCCEALFDKPAKLLDAIQARVEHWCRTT